MSPATATPENTTTSLTVPTLTVGAEGAPAAFTGTVAGPASGDGVPAGTVTVFLTTSVSPGQTQLCQTTLSGGSGDSVNYSCSLAGASQFRRVATPTWSPPTAAGHRRTAASPTTPRRRAPKASR